MMFSYQQTLMVESLNVLPDWLYNADPKPANEITYTVPLAGESQPRAIYIQGASTGQIILGTGAGQVGTQLPQE